MPKKVYNNFYFFMLEKKNEYNKKGIKYTMKQMSEVASPMWNALKPEEREKYNTMAKEYKSQQRHVDSFGGKLAGDGTRIMENFAQEELYHKEISTQRLEIRTLIGANSEEPDGFQKNAGIKFYVMEFNTACKVDEDDVFIPIEIGLVEYSIQDGITNSYHKVIDFGPPPVGYFGACKDHSEQYHKLFLNSDVSKEKNYKKIWNDIMIFLCGEHDQLPPPIFTHHENFEVGQTLGSLRWLADKTGNMRVFDKMCVWSLAYLLFELRDAIHEPLPQSICIDMLNGSSFDYIPGINCDFHEEIDTIYCAVGSARRKCFLLSDAVCKLFDVVPTTSHIPNRSSSNKDYTIHIPSHLANPEPTVPRSVRVGDKVDLNTKSHFDDLDDFDDDEEDPPQPVFSSKALGRGLPLQMQQTVPQMNQKFANMGLGRGKVLRK